jgi:hypothetical protein
MNENRGPWYLITGILFGLFIGVAISLWILPVKYSQTEPYTLRSQDKTVYRSLIADAYLVEADNNRALLRLALLRDADPAGALISQAQSIVASNGDELTARALALLAAAVSQPSVRITPIGPMISLVTPIIEPSTTPTGQAITPTRTPFATTTPFPTATIQPTLGAPFVLVKQETICDPVPARPLLEVIVSNAAGVPIPGVKIEISQTNGGIETFYTGLYPEISPGYADYSMLAGMVYALRVGDAGQLVPNLAIPLCQNSGGADTAGSIRLEFQQP